MSAGSETKEGKRPKGKTAMGELGQKCTFNFPTRSHWAPAPHLFYFRNFKFILYLISKTCHYILHLSIQTRLALAPLTRPTARFRFPAGIKTSRRQRHSAADSHGALIGSPGDVAAPTSREKVHTTTVHLYN